MTPKELNQEEQQALVMEDDLHMLKAKINLQVLVITRFLQNLGIMQRVELLVLA